MGSCFSRFKISATPPSSNSPIPLDNVPDRTRYPRRPTGLLRRGSSSQTRMGPPSLNALRDYATVRNPARSIPASTLLYHNAHTLAIFDAFPKAKYHFLILPRFPFPPASLPDSDESLVPLAALEDLRSLLLKGGKHRDDVLAAMAETAREVEEMIRDEMIKTEGFEWKIDIGFHAVPSMRHVHLHVISEDRISHSMKTKRHHNSFRPDLGFFIPLQEVQSWLQTDEASLRDRVAALSSAEAFLTSPLSCFRCDNSFENMPKLKAHWEKEFAQMKKTALERIARTGRQNSDDSDEF